MKESKAFWKMVHEINTANLEPSLLGHMNATCQLIDIVVAFHPPRFHILLLAYFLTVKSLDM